MALNLVLSIPALATFIGGGWLCLLVLSEMAKDLAPAREDWRGARLSIAADAGLALVFAAMMWTGARDLIAIWVLP